NILTSPELIQLFLIKYLIPITLLPTLEEMNKNAIQPVVTSQPVPPAIQIEKREKEIIKEAFENEFSKEGCKLLTNMLNVYVFDRVLKKDVPLNDEIKSFALEFVDKIIAQKI